MRKRLITLLLMGTLLTAAACSGKDAEEPGAGTQSGPPRAENSTLPQAAPGTKEEAVPENASEPDRVMKTEALPNSGVQGLKPDQKPVSALDALDLIEREYDIEELITSIKMPEEWYAFSCDKDKVIFYSRGEEYGWLEPYRLTPVKGGTEVDGIIRDLSGAGDIAELIDTREEGNALRYVFAVHRSRYAMGEVEFLAQAGIISEEEALAQEQTELFIAYKVNGGQWWSFSTKSDVFGGEGLLDALEFEITFADKIEKK